MKMTGDRMPIEAAFSPDSLPLASEDPLYSLVAAYEADRDETKIDLGVGAYRDDDAKPWVLPVVRKAERIIYEDKRKDHEYLPIAGLPEFTSAAQKLVLGSGSPAIEEGRVCTFQTISGTGAVHLGAALLAKFLPRPNPSVYISTPTWPIHDQVFSNLSLPTAYYPYFSDATKILDFDGMISTIQSAPRGSIVLLHACAHNPTGVDPTLEQWQRIAEVMQELGHFPFFDCAYQGFASGSLIRDNSGIRLFVDMGFSTIIAQSFAKNLGLYGERVGAVHYVASPGPGATDSIRRVASQLSILQRSEISSPPIYGAKIAAVILNREDLFLEWQEDLRTMSGRIQEMRRALKRELDKLQTPGSWDQVLQQTGMFSFTGLSEDQVFQLREKWHVYMAKTGRISVAGLNTKNVAYFARAVDDVVRHVDSR